MYSIFNLSSQLWNIIFNYLSIKMCKQSVQIQSLFLLTFNPSTVTFPSHFPLLLFTHPPYFSLSHFTFHLSLFMLQLSVSPLTFCLLTVTFHPSNIIFPSYFSPLNSHFPSHFLPFNSHIPSHFSPLNSYF